MPFCYQSKSIQTGVSNHFKLWVCLLMRDTPQYRKTKEILLRTGVLAKKVQEGLRTSALLLSKDGIVLVLKEKERKKRERTSLVHYP